MKARAKGRKRAPAREVKRPKLRARMDLDLGEDIESEEEGEQQPGPDVDEDELEESAEQKRVRLAREYLRSVQAQGGDESESEEEDERYQLTSDRLSRERLDAQGKLFRNVAGAVEAEAMQTTMRALGGHKGAVTGVALSADSSTVFSCSKDNSLISWDAETGAKTFLKPMWTQGGDGALKSHDGELLAVACTSDPRFVACAGRDSMVRVFDVRSGTQIKALAGHRGAVTCLAFQKNTNTLFSGSEDRCVKQWDLNEMGYLETLFGHQESVNALDCWSREQPVSASGDRTVRVFKVAQQSHLVFRGHQSAVDAVQAISDSTYVSGGQDGALCLWRETSKKPVSVVKAAHGSDGASPRWIVSLAALKMSDFVASGSHDGSVRLWEASNEAGKLREVAALQVEGFVNSLAVTGRLLVAGTGSEHRLGRWWRLPGNKNKVVLARMPDVL